jgi:hypothetical protein
MSSDASAPSAPDLWDFLRARASMENPESLSFYDTHDAVLYRDVDLQEIGKHGWELVTVLIVTPSETKPSLYEYFFKRNRTRGYSGGFGHQRAN